MLVCVDIVFRTTRIMDEYARLRIAGYQRLCISVFFQVFTVDEVRCTEGKISKNVGLHNIQENCHASNEY